MKLPAAKALDVTLPVVLGAVALGVRVSAGPLPVDDAYITFRYAANLAGGLGLVYNAGERVLGSTTPLFALALALAARLTPATIPWVALGVSAMADAIACFLLYRLGRRLHLARPLAGVTALFWALHPFSVRYAIGGMETSLATCLLLGCFALYLERRDAWAAVLAGLAILTRPDAALAGALLLAALLIERRRIPWRQLWIIAGIVAPWALWATWFYGSPLPHSVLAKSQMIYRVGAQDSARQILFELGGLWLNGPLGWGAQGISMIPPIPWQRPLLALAVVNVAIWEWGAAVAGRLSRRWWAFSAFPALFAGIYALMGTRSTLVAEWHLVPVFPFWWLGLTAGLQDGLRRLLGPRASAYAAWGLVTVLVAAQLAGFNLGREPERAAFVPRNAWLEREDLYREIAAFLRPRLAGGDVVAATEIGALGYACDCRILDTVGLVSPEAMPYYPLAPEYYVSIYAVPPGLMEARAPRYLVSLDVFIRKSLAEAEWFRRRYQLIWERPSDAFGSIAMQVFERRD